MKIIFCASILFGATVLSAADYEIVEKNDFIQIDTNRFATEHHQQGVRILTAAGAGYREYLAVNSFIQIQNVHCSVQFPDGRVAVLRKEDIAEVPISESANMMTDYKALVIAPPNLEPGAIVKLSYDRQISSLLYLDPWVYATSVPIRKASCSVTFPSQLALKYRGQDGTVTVRQNQAAGKTTFLFETSNQKEISLYGSSESLGSIEKKVVFMPEQCVTGKWTLSTKSWTSVAEWFSELSQFAYQTDPAMDSIVLEIVREHKGEAAIAEALYEYIQKNFAYTAIEIGMGGYKPRFASQTFQKKYGDCKDLTLLYLALLKKAGIEGYPALVDTRNGRFFYQDFPSPTQFNHCIAFLPKIRNGTWVDSTVKNFRLGEIPSIIQGKYALVSGGPNTLMKIPEDLWNSNVLRFQLTGKYTGKELNWDGRIETLGQATLFPHSIKNALTKNRIQNYIYSTWFLAEYPAQSLDADYEDVRSLQISFRTPVQQLTSYRILLLNSVRYLALDHLVLDPQTSEFFALGSPARLVMESDVDLMGLRLVSAPLQTERNGQYVKFKMQLSEAGGKLHYFVDAYFANGFLDDSQMKTYQQELREFSTHLQRTAIVQ